MSIYCNIKKKLGHFSLNICFESQDNTVALMGASGCGKSITLKCIAGIEQPDSGVIVINGMTVFDSDKKINLPPQKRHAGYLFQDYALFPNMTVEKNIATVMDKNKKNKTKELIKSFHLEGLEAHYPSQLSGGQKQRCALARMIASEPQIIMLDEPFSALDSYLRWQLEQEVTAVIKKFGKTVLFVSHDRDEVYRISDKVVVIDHGINEKICSKQELYSNPKTYADALLTGCKNILPVEFIEDMIIVPGYGLKFYRKHIDGNFGFIGIRAKQIIPAHLLKKGQNAFLFDYSIVDITEAVFSMILRVRIEDGEELIRWELSKKDYKDLDLYPSKLAILESEILLLENKN